MIYFIQFEFFQNLFEDPFNLLIVVVVVNLDNDEAQIPREVCHTAIAHF